MNDHDQKELARAVADELVKRIQREVGKSILAKIFWVLVGGVILLAIWTGQIKITTG